MKVVLVYNPESGSDTSLVDLKSLFAAASIEIIDTIALKPRFETALKPHIKQARIIAVVGGDGSLSTVANAIVNTDAVLMPLSGGTLNHFTKDLNIPQDIPEALTYFKQAKKTKIDAARVDNKVFINNSSIGVYSDSLVDRDIHKKIYGKWLSMLTSTFTTLFRFRTYDVELNGKKYSTPLIFIGNNQYERSGLAFRRVSLNKKQLSVYMITGESRLSLALAAIGIILGKKKVVGALKSFNATSLRISTNHSIRVSRDGEHEKMTPPLSYDILESSLYVLHK